MSGSRARGPNYDRGILGRYRSGDLSNKTAREKGEAWLDSDNGEEGCREVSKNSFGW